MTDKIDFEADYQSGCIYIYGLYAAEIEFFEKVIKHMEFERKYIKKVK